MENKETLEEVAEKVYISHKNNDLLYGHSEELQLAYKAGVVDGAKWQAERMYSEEEVLEFCKWFDYELKHYGYPNDENILKALKQFKKK